MTRYPDGNGFELKRKLAGRRCAVDAAQVTWERHPTRHFSAGRYVPHLAPGLNAPCSANVPSPSTRSATQAVGAEGRAVKARAGA
ncbi:hypothetical protein ACPA9J_22440 [Pseudomonas aeruginosa]